MIVTLSWDPNPAEELVSGYNVYESFNGGGFILRETVTEPTLDIVDPPSGLYNWKVSAVNIAGEGNQSAAVAGPQLPSVPTNITVEVN